ncbi:MAG: alpha amylase C-terminal domain-containing protein [Rhodospirillaceae bacterium]
MPAPQDHVSAATAMGANLAGDGATFRVWAPGAAAVHVVGRLAGRDDWTPHEGNRLVRRDGGHWTGFVPGARDGDRYKFHVAGTGGAGLKRDPYARELSSDPPYPHSDCILRDPASYPWHDAAWRAPAFSDLVVYQLHVGTFWGPTPGQRVATFLDAIGRLDYLADLGVTAVQPLPIGEFAGPRSRGYGGSDLFSPEMDYTLEGDQVDPYLPAVNAQLARHGQPPLTAAQLVVPINQLKAFVDLCHLKGLAVLFDVVFNHAGSEIRGQDEGLWFFDRAAVGDANDSLYFTDQDWTGPVFAFWKSEVRQFLIDNAAFFVREYHVDGFRYDEASVIDRSGADGWRLCQDCTSTVRFIDPSAIHIAEYWGVNPWVVRPRAAGGAGFDATWNDGLRDSVRNAIAAASCGRDAFVDLGAVAGRLDRGDFPARWQSVEYVESHDEVYQDRGRRIAALADPGDARSWHARSRARVATGLILTAPGIPMLFMGQEFLEDRQWSDNPGFHADTLLNWAGLDGGDRAMADHHRFTRELIRLRRRHPALRGEGLRVTCIDEFNRILVFQRWVDGGGRDAVVVVSLNESTQWGYRIGLPWAGHWVEAFNSDVYDHWVNPHTAGNGGIVLADSQGFHNLPASATMVVPANALVVLTSDGGDP